MPWAEGMGLRGSLWSSLRLRQTSLLPGVPVGRPGPAGPPSNAAQSSSCPVQDGKLGRVLWSELGLEHQVGAHCLVSRSGEAWVPPSCTGISGFAPCLSLWGRHPTLSTLLPCSQHRCHPSCPRWLLIGPAPSRSLCPHCQAFQGSGSCASSWLLLSWATRVRCG